MHDPGGHLNQEEFRAEAEEILEKLGDELREAESEIAQGGIRAGRINSLFRGVHTLKGIAGLLGREDLGALAHKLEDFLDRLRMGRVELSGGKLDLLYDTHEMLEQMLEGKAVDEARVRELAQRLGGGEQPPGDAPEAAALEPGFAAFDSQILGALTEYEEHRLRESIAANRKIWLVDVSLDLETFDTELRNLIAILNEAGEVLSTLPSYAGSGDGRTLAFRLLYAGEDDQETVRRRAGMDVAVVSPFAVEEVSDDVVSPVPGGEGAADADGSEMDAWGPQPRSSVRVDLERLDQIMNHAGALILSRRKIESLMSSLAEREEASGIRRDIERAAEELGKKLDGLQRSVIGARMVPVGQIVGRLDRLVRKLSRRASKTIRFCAEGERTELDKVMIDRLLSPLMHLVRNAVDHGIETPDERRAAGKSPTGTLQLTAEQRGNAVVLAFADDGRGIDPERIQQKAISRGILDGGTQVSPEEVSDLLFCPGFSTADAVSDVSGRGVGLDVVRREIAAVGGSMRIQTMPGQGTTFEMELPITMAIIQSMLTRAGGQVFAIPVSAVAETLRMRGDRLATVAREHVVRLRGETLPMVSLAEYFRIAESDAGVPAYVMVLRCGERSLALGIDNVIGQQEIVLKSIGGRLSSISGLAGATEIGENEAALVIDPMSLAGDVWRAAGAA
ncbi:MAG: chemotaxis protein CheA [Acidobacteriota bacterium]